MALHNTVQHNTVQHNPVPSADAAAIRPFHFKASEEQLADLRRRIAATRWPDREIVTDPSQGVQLATMQKLAHYWADGLRLAQVRGEAQRPAAIRHEDRWARHPLHSCAFETSERVADHRHARMARLDHRAVEDHRPADESHRTWRKRVRRFRCRDSFAAGPRVFREADHSRLGPCSHRTRLDRPDEAPRLHAICGAGRRLGECGHRADGVARASGVDRHSHQHAWPPCRPTSQRRSCPAARRPASRPKSSHAYDQLDFFYSTAWATPRR